MRQAVTDQYGGPSPASGASVHRDLINFFLNSTKPGRFDAGVDLDTMRQYRVRADYSAFIAPAFLQTNTIVSLQLAVHREGRARIKLDAEAGNAGEVAAPVWVFV